MSFLETLEIVHTKILPIAEWLDLEKKLFFEEEKNFCLLHEKAPLSVILGRTGNNPSLYIEQEKMLKDQVPLLQRMSGGGTVVIDEDTLFVSFIFSKKNLPFQPFPEPFLRFAEKLYQEAWQIPLCLQEKDFVIQDKKCGGNALYITQKRCLLHTSFLWNFKKEHMSYLKFPPKVPSYRKSRSHEEFLCTLSSYFTSIDEPFALLKNYIKKAPLART